MKLNEKLKILRKNKKLTQKELSKYLGITPAAISQYEKAKSIPSNEILKKYASFFDIPFINLIDFKQYQSFEKNFETLASDFFKDYEPLEIPYFEGLSAGSESNLVINKDTPTIRVFLKKHCYSSANNLIAIRINGESMSKVIADHSIAIIDKGADIKSGDIIAYQLGCDEYGIKRLYDYPEYIKLCPESYDLIFKDKTLLKSSLSDERFIIIGKLISSISDSKTLKY